MHAAPATPLTGAWQLSHWSDRNACFAESGPGLTNLVHPEMIPEPPRYKAIDATAAPPKASVAATT